MLKKSITYEDYNGEEVTEDFFFHLSKAELVEIELSHKGGLSNSIQNIIDSEDGKTIIAEFKSIILKAYGVKSSDGKRFIKNQEVREAFESSAAYSVLFMEIVTDAEKAAEFIQATIPAGLVEEATTEAKQERMDIPMAEPRKPSHMIMTRAELNALDPETFASVMKEVSSGEVVIEG